MLGDVSPRRVELVGGTAVLSEQVRSEAVEAAGGVGVSSRRLGGATRTDTAARAARAGAGRDCVAAALVANGWSDPDVGTAAVLGAAWGSSVVLYADAAGSLGDAARDAIADLAPRRVMLIGGTDTLSEAIRDQLPAGRTAPRVTDAHHAARLALGDAPDDCDNTGSGGSGGGTTSGGTSSGGTSSTGRGSESTQVTTDTNNGGVSTDDSDAPAPGTPSLPLNLTVDAANTELRLTWEKPEDSGNFEVTGYVLQVRTTSESWSHETSNQRLGPDARATTVVGLDNGTAVVVRVAAENQAGRGHWASVSGTPAVSDGAPGEPQGFSAYADRLGGLTVTWRKPADEADASSPIAYRLQSKRQEDPWSSAIEQRTDDQDSTSTVYDSVLDLGFAAIADVDRGEVYELRIAAVNDAGTGTWAEFEVFNGDDKPGKVQNLVVEITGAGADAELLVRWSPPRYSLTPVSGYIVRWFPFDLTSISDLEGEAMVALPGYSIPLVRLGPERYAISIAAVNEVGEGLRELDVSFRGTTPTEPGGLAAAQEETAIEVSWTAPRYGGISGVTGYKVRWRSADSSVWNSADSADKGPSVLSHSISGLTTGSYVVGIKVVSGLQESVEAEAEFVYAGIPSTPGTPTLTPGDGRLTAEWSAPSDDGVGTARYVVQWKPAAVVSWDDADEVEVSARSTAYTIEGLTNGASQSVRAAAKTPAGTGPWSEAQNAAAAASGTNDPRDLVLEGRHVRMHVNWTVPQQASSVAHYRVQWRLGGQAFSLEQQIATVTKNKTSMIIYGPLETSVVYVVRVTALDGDGESLASALAAAEVVSARDHIEEQFVKPLVDDFEWIRDAWYKTPVKIGIRSRSLYAGGMINLTIFHYRSLYIFLHELAHHFTLQDNVPSNKLSVAVGMLYYFQLVGDDCIGFEIMADAILYATLEERGYYGYLSSCRHISVPPNAEAQSVGTDISRGKTPKWLFDTYSSDGTMEGVDLDRLFADVARVAGEPHRMTSLFAGYLAEAFGGYCSRREGFGTFGQARNLGADSFTPYKNPWIDGGCETRWPRLLTVRSGGAGELNVNWREPYWTTTPEINAYVVQWKSGTQAFDTSRQAVITDLENLSHTITELTSGTEYSVRVAAVNADDPTDMTEFAQTAFVDDDGRDRVAETTGTAE